MVLQKKIQLIITVVEQGEGCPCLHLKDIHSEGVTFCWYTKLKQDTVKESVSDAKSPHLMCLNFSWFLLGTLFLKHI